MPQESSSVQMNHILAEMNKEGGFPISVLTDAQGLTIASSAGDGLDPERYSAVAAFLQKAVLQGSRQLGMTGVDEICFSDTSGQYFMCRLFLVNEQGLILAVLSPDKQHAYRRVTKQAVSRIRIVWKNFWN